MSFYRLILIRIWDALVRPAFYPDRSRRKLASYFRKAMRFRSQQRAARAVNFPPLPALHVILTSFKREANIRHILESVLLLPYVEKVLISNNNPTVLLRLGEAGRDSRVRVLNHSEPMSCGYRFDLAQSDNGERILLIDDDVLLTPQQIDTLYQAFLETPDRPHGIRGQVWSDETDNPGLTGLSGERDVDVLNQCYLIDRSQLTSMYGLMERFGVGECRLLHNAEDLFVSFSGKQRPRIHNIGPWLDCPTSYRRDTAIWLSRPDFHDERNALFLSLRRARDNPDERAGEWTSIAARLCQSSDS